MRIKAVSFSPDGKRIVSGTNARTLKVWDAQTGQETLTLKGHSGSVTSVSFSPPGALLGRRLHLAEQLGADRCIGIEHKPLIFMGRRRMFEPVGKLSVRSQPPRQCLEFQFS